MMRDEIKSIVKLAAPIIVTQITATLFGFIDVLIIGHLGTSELAAVAFANSVFIVFLIFGIGLTNAATPLISRAVGRTDFYGARKILKDALLVNLFAGIVLTALCLLCLLAFDRMGQSPSILKDSKTFFSIMSLTLVPALLYQALKAYLECLGRATVPMMIAVGGLCLNIILCLVLVFGFGPIPAFGVAGAATATFISRLCMLSILAGYIRWEITHREFQKQPNRFEFLSRKNVVKELVTLGIPTAFIVTFEVGAFAASAVIVGWIGVAQLAAHQITLSLVSLTFMVPMGLAIAATIRVGHEIGREDYPAAKRAGSAALICATAFMATAGVVLLIGRKIFPQMFDAKGEVLEMAAVLIIVGALFQISDGVQVVAAGLLRALKDVRWPMVVTFICYWIVALPLGYLLGFQMNFGAAGIWSGLLVGLTIAAIALTRRFYRLIDRDRTSH